MKSQSYCPKTCLSFSDQDNLYRFLEANYTTSFQSVGYKPSVDAFLSDNDCGYCGLSVLANNKIKKGVVIPGLVGVVGNLTEGLDFEFDFSTFVCQYTHQTRLVRQPLLSPQCCLQNTKVENGSCASGHSP